MKIIPPCLKFLAIILPLCSGPLLSAVQPAIDVGARRQVFIDGRFIGSAAGVSLVVHPPMKTRGATLDATHPDKTMISRNGTVLFADGIYHMWYAAFERARERWPEGEEPSELEKFSLDDQFCYAWSEDGINWHKPDMGVPPPYDGAEPNGCPVYDENDQPMTLIRVGMVFLDPNALPTERFRFVHREIRRTTGRPDSLEIFSSPDGRVWRRTHRDVLSYADKPHHLDSPNVAFWDGDLGQYVAYVRRNIHGNIAQGRTVARAATTDLAHFPGVDVSPIVLKWDATDPTSLVLPEGRELSMVDFYNSSAVKYEWADAAYYLFPSAYYHYHEEVQREFAGEEPTNAGPVDIRFAASRDGLIWHRFDRRAFVDLGLRDEFDAMLLYMFRGVVPGANETEMFMYYTGSDRTHGWDRNVRNKRILTAAGLEPKIETSFVSRLVLRRDGFISVRSEYDGGQFTTPPLRFTGDRLRLNLDTSATGEVRVEIQDEQGVPLEGFTLPDCDRIHTANEINRVVTWRGSAALDALQGRTVRLRFIMRDADLYAFQFGGDE